MKTPDRGLFYAIIFFTSGILISAYGPGFLWRLAICAVLLIILIVLDKSRGFKNLRDILLLLLFLTIGWMRGGYSQSIIMPEGDTWINAQVLYPVEKNDEYTRARLKLNSWEKLDRTARLKGKALAYFDQNIDIQPGSEIKLAASIHPIEKSMNPGDFDRRAYWNLRGINWKLQPKDRSRVEIIKDKTFSGFITKLLYKFSSYSEEQIHRYFMPESAVLAQSLLSGSRLNWDDGLRDQLSNSGLMHLFAISGLHVGIIAGFFLKVLPFLRLGVKSTYSIIFVVIWIYVLFTGANPPVIRAAMMFSIWIGARLLGRFNFPFHGLLLSWLVLLLIHPQGISDAGFQLSFAGAGGAVYAAHKFRYLVLPFQAGPLEGVKVSRFFTLNRIIYYLLVSIGAWLATSPIVIWHFGKLPWLAPIVTLPAVYLIAIAIATIWIVVFFSFVPGIASIIASAGHVIFWLISKITSIQSQFSPVSENLPAITAFWAVTAIFFAVLFTKHVEKSPFKSSLFTTLSLLIITLLSNTSFYSQSVKFGVLYVGQGDGILIRKGDRAVVIDGGPAKSEALNKQLRLCGIKEIDAWIITHGDSDHAAAVSKLSDKIKVKYAIIGPGTTNDKAGKEAIKYLTQNGAEVQVGRKDTRLNLGSMGNFEIIAPDNNIYMRTADDNDLSLVIKWTLFDKTLIFPGDISSRIENYLVESNLDLDTDFLLLAHHGSKYSSSSRWIAACDPEICANSSGINNFYSHPAPEVIGRLDSLNIDLLRTDQLGALTFKIDRHGIKRIKWFQWW